MFRLPMFGFTCLSFLMLLVVIAIATWLVFRSHDPARTKLSGCAGCAIGFALLLIAGLGALGCTAVAVLTAPTEVVRRGPISRFELHWPRDDDRREDEAGATPSAETRNPARIRLTLRDGERAAEIAGEISRWLREESAGDLSVRIETEKTASGEVTRIEFALPIARRELEELRDELRREFPRLSIPEGVEVEIRED